MADPVFRVEVKEYPRGFIDAITGGSLAKQLTLIVKDAMNNIGAHAAERALANAPIDTQHLRETIRYTMRRVSQGIEVKIIATPPYAYRMHEQLTPAGPLQLGPKSRNQPFTPEGGVGGKYITRVIAFHLPTYTKHLGQMIEKNLPGFITGSIRPIKISRGRS